MNSIKKKNPQLLWLCVTCFYLSSGCSSSSTPAGDARAPASEQPAEPIPDNTPAPLFKEVGLSANLTHSHRLATAFSLSSSSQLFSGGATSADLNGDGLLDIYLIGGNGSRNSLYLNTGSLSFMPAEVPELELAETSGSGPIFADIDGDYLDDLFVGGVEGEPVRLFKNLGNLAFEDVTLTSGLVNLPANNLSPALGDMDLDGDLDLFISHWGAEIQKGVSTQHLWENVSDGEGLLFNDISVSANITAGYSQDPKDFSFTPIFSDINGDGFPDLLVASDYGTTKVFLNSGVTPTEFTKASTENIAVSAGMGAAAGDYDNDGDVDWFVSAISKPSNSATSSYTGNALYENVGDGHFLDVTKASGVEAGMWAWGTCFADFNNDAALDIFLTNGWPQAHYEEYERTASYLYISNGDGTFTDRSMQNGITEKSQGRGVICADFDRDGDIDILVANNNSRPLLYKNLTESHFGVSIQLTGLPPNTRGVGAKVTVTIDQSSQFREISLGSNYVSNNPAEAHFGIGSARMIDHIEVAWPDGAITLMQDVPVENIALLTIKHPNLP